MSELPDRLQDLSPQKKELLFRKLSTLAKSPDSLEGQAGVKGLSAYLVMDSSAPTPSQKDFRDFLKSKLPDYMVPSEFVFLDQIPLTPNGKVDRNALQQIKRDNFEVEEGSFVPPRNETEETLAQIWRDLLGFDEIGIYDNFLEIGGDSLLSIRMIARANSAGMKLAPHLLIDYPTIAELASLLENSQKTGISQEAAEGDFQLLPIQQWFMEWNHPEPDHWNQSLLLETPKDCDLQVMEKSIQALVAHHDALRMTVKRDQDNWIGHIAKRIEVSLEHVEVPTGPLDQQYEIISTIATKLHRSLNIQTGPIFRGAYFDLGSELPGRLLLLIHHLAVDWVSWGVILDDLHRLYQAFLNAPNASSPRLAKTTSIKSWSEQLKNYGRSDKLAQEAALWIAEAEQTEYDLPVDLPTGENTVSSEETVIAALAERATHQLLSQANEAYQTQVEEILLTALAKTFYDWTGENHLRVGLEGHGREQLFDGLDLSRTVGWFTSYYPLRISLENPENAGESIKIVKETFRSVPNRGTGYGILRYLANSDAAEKLKTATYPKVLFNYLGRTGTQSQEDVTFRIVDNAPLGSERSKKGLRRYLLEINAFVQDERLQLSWTYSRNLHHSASIKDLSSKFLTNLGLLIEHCLDPESGGFTPSDFPLADLDDSELDKLSNLLNQIE